MNTKPQVAQCTPVTWINNDANINNHVYYKQCFLPGLWRRRYNLQHPQSGRDMNATTRFSLGFGMTCLRRRFSHDHHYAALWLLKFMCVTASGNLASIPMCIEAMMGLRALRRSPWLTFIARGAPVTQKARHNNK